MAILFYQNYSYYRNVLIVLNYVSVTIIVRYKIIHSNVDYSMSTYLLSDVKVFKISSKEITKYVHDFHLPYNSKTKMRISGDKFHSIHPLFFLDK